MRNSYRAVAFGVIAPACISTTPANPDTQTWTARTMASVNNVNGSAAVNDATEHTRPAPTPVDDAKERRRRPGHPWLVTAALVAFVAVNAIVSAALRRDHRLSLIVLALSLDAATGVVLFRRRG
ncbi:MAG: hypothetical protein QOC82_368 [Frankiaceae bacterium]|jgi:hypothetical protein|nr:hypothetical protein [Frankiaceae bacterium]